MSFTYPNEEWPADAAVEAIDGTTDEDTGLPYIAKGTGPTSLPTYEVQYNRRQQRQNKILAGWRHGMVVSEGNSKIGVYPMRFTLGGYHRVFEGATNQAVPDDSIKYVYLDSSVNLQIADSWPSDITSYVPLAKVVTSAGVLSIEDMRVYAGFHVSQIDGPGDITGTPNPTFHVDSDGSGPKLKNNTGVLQIRNAPDSAYATIDAASINVWGAEAIDGSRNVKAGTVQLDAAGPGPKLKNNSGDAQVRDAADSGYAAIDAASVKVGGTEAINSSGEAVDIVDDIVSGEHVANQANGTGGLPVIFAASLTSGNTVAIHNNSAPFKYRIIDAWSIATSGDGGSWKLTDGTNDITDTVTVTATDKTMNRVGQIDDAYHEIADSGTLQVVGDGSNADVIVYATAIRVS